ncbi:GIY-YIG nuclease family protein [Candidatus Wolfebacteria bacterium]|uniref:Endonuclease n=1 Tax=Candidatus Wolfebacteria bacterium CG_4_10_14_0_2_um_filter_39_18 TaxID=1975061 RepID=A0A2M7TG85_9BACT|nr:GIY-YIG nuclease family protein [Candidatus Wolfebacteria bacterium]PIZ44994.1 MAG: endonuclease [Candidatus Wolfebacteria bacterium CG_4_10_14_0_2_um_filter_39_18]
MYFVYILRSRKDNNVYIGITSDIERRLKQHNSGKNLSTKYRTPFDLIYSEKTENRVDARNREKYFKSGVGREWIRDNMRP